MCYVMVLWSSALCGWVMGWCVVVEWCTVWWCWGGVLYGGGGVVYCACGNGGVVYCVVVVEWCTVWWWWGGVLCVILSSTQV